MLNVLLEAEVISTISSSAVSGSSTTVNVTPPVMSDPAIVPKRFVADATVIDVAPDVTAAVSVVCCERDVYFLTVIYLPIGCSGRGLGTEVFASMILLQDASCKRSEVVLLRLLLCHMDVLHQFHQIVVMK
jgi:hypothetical protein